MILYADTSALVKRYIQETGTAEVLACLARFQLWPQRRSLRWRWPQL